MTPADLCDAAYAILLDRVERAALVERQVCAVLLRAGAEDIGVPTAAEAMADFEAALSAPPEAESMTDQIRRELGI